MDQGMRILDLSVRPKYDTCIESECGTVAALTAIAGTREGSVKDRQPTTVQRVLLAGGRLFYAGQGRAVIAELQP